MKNEELSALIYCGFNMERDRTIVRNERAIPEGFIYVDTMKQIKDQFMFESSLVDVSIGGVKTCVIHSVSEYHIIKGSSFDLADCGKCYADEVNYVFARLRRELILSMGRIVEREWGKLLVNSKE